MSDIDLQPPAAATIPRRFQCRHIFTDGHRCGSPCLCHEDFCYYHHNARGRRALRSHAHTIDLSQGEHRASPFTLPNPEDRPAIQVSIGEILSRLASNELDPRRAGLLLYGLQIASINLPHTKLTATPPEPVEDTVTHPDLGTVALPAELKSAEARSPSSLVSYLLQQLSRRPGPSPAKTPDSQKACPAGEASWPNRTPVQSSSPLPRRHRRPGRLP